MDNRSIAATAEVVTVEADVQVTKRHLPSEQLLEQYLQTPREKRAAPVDPHQSRRRQIGVALGYLMRDTRQRSRHIPLAEDDLLSAFVQLFLPGLTGPG